MANTVVPFSGSPSPCNTGLTGMAWTPFGERGAPGQMRGVAPSVSWTSRADDLAAVEVEGSGH